MSTATPAPGAPREGAKKASGASETLLLVDDERNILSSLRRLFRPLGYRILTAEGGEEALEKLAEHPVNLIISDMRMPGMDGAQLLEKVADAYPDTVRILLTGFADLSSTIEAINKGRIYRYLSKPWEDTEITLAVRQALDTQRLEREKRELTALTERQNRELRDLNENLELKVRQRTEELQQTADMLDLAFAEVRDSYHNIMRVFAGLVGMRESLSARYSERIAVLAQRLGLMMGAPEEEADDIYYAGLLHLLGKLSLRDSLVDKPPYLLDHNARKAYQQHPVNAQTALMPVEALAGVARLLRSQEECWDGSGFPDAISGNAILFGARVLAVARDFFGFRNGRLLPDRLSAKASLERMESLAGKVYDPAVVRALGQLMGAGDSLLDEDKVTGVRMSSNQLEAGMQLARDLYSSRHTLLLTEGRVFTDGLIRKLMQLEEIEQTAFDIYVVAPEASDGEKTPKETGS